LLPLKRWRGYSGLLLCTQLCSIVSAQVQ